MARKVLGTVFVFSLLITLFSCKKENADDSVNGRFQGTWVEKTERKATLVVDKPPVGDEMLPAMMLNISSGSGVTGYPFTYKFNDAGTEITFSSNEGVNKKYAITFSNNNKTFSIKKFHSTLPNIDPVVFDKID